ncbi:NTP transferase domain-containing protein [Aquabacter spiritensis]|uniref:Molybdopterin molybdochelatase /molybdenum cofactor cytidylyltransferase n=1 Tax=Aquabacter spiritensis TaxID=933073 RepID=A0A4R3M0M8_9HYPH|nr:molybdopterin-binding/glycosyltransferase family 2 protein [Aquabacter spiritensis]TCT04647.1 molybdopterin molybdochelatase /molybdenum cofactor cytidylyltransferase [Aquabacter spiritensis]
MRFGPVPLAQACGAIAAHSVKTNGVVVRKGTRLGAEELDALAAAGAQDVTVALFEPGDVDEDAAAFRLAAACSGSGTRVAAPFTGRANLHATAAGVLMVDAGAVDAFNLVDEAITLATLPAFRPVAVGDLVATVKIIPYAVPEMLLAHAAARAAGLVRVQPFRRTKIAVVSTRLSGLAEKVVEKTIRVTGERLARLGGHVASDVRIPHEGRALEAALRAARDEGADLILVFGASAIADRRDVIPAALEAVGGRVERLGMPVDPGNLLMLGFFGDLPVIGAPGCARSPKENGFDFILARLLADIPVTSGDIARMGSGGLIGEIVTRPQPREEEPAPAKILPEPQIAAVVLAAGRGTRMGGPNKLLAEIGGRPVVRRVAEAALASRAEPVIVVTGHEGAEVVRALGGLDVIPIANPNYAQGLATSLAAGIAAVPEGAAGALVMLGDMPLLEAETIDRLIAAFSPVEGRLIVVPVAGGRRGNPVLWSRRFFAALSALEGDIGARALIAAHAEAVFEVEVAGEGTHLDVDTPAALAAARAASGEE